jgi:hypothetical protein
MAAAADLAAIRAMRATLPPRVSGLIVATEFYGFTAVEYAVIGKSILNLYMMDSKLNTSERMNHFNPLPNHALLHDLITGVGPIPL